MRIAIISDSHGNVTALNAVLSELDRTGPFDEVLFGGDIAYGGPFPGECISAIAERGYRSVRGNTDQMILDARDGNDDGHGVWVAERLSREQIEFLDGLPVQVDVELADGNKLGLVHATPWSIYESVLPDHDVPQFEKMLETSGVNTLAYGHIHLQHERATPQGNVVAVGSLGLPFDGDQRAMYAVLEFVGRDLNVEFRRLEYDVERAIHEARQSEGPACAGFATNLSTARRPG